VSPRSLLADSLADSCIHFRCCACCVRLSFPMGIGKDPTTGMPRVSLGWRHEPHVGPPQYNPQLQIMQRGSRSRCS
jgi:hypothetical protein